MEILTSRDRPKSAPYPRLKNSKTTSKCQVLFYSTRKSKFFEKKFFEKITYSKKMDRVARRGSLARAPGALKSHNAEKLKGRTLWGFSTSILSQNMKKLKKTKIFIFGKKSHNAEKNWKGGPFGIFQHPFCRKTSKKCRGTLWGKNFFSEKKSRSAEKNERGESLVSPGMVCYAEKQEKPFWFSSLDQIVHFGPIIFCRTFKNYFGQFVWIEKKKKKEKSL